LTLEGDFEWRRSRSAASGFDNQRRFVLDIAFFSSIIYIWYEGRRLKPPVVTQPRGCHTAEPNPFRRTNGEEDCEEEGGQEDREEGGQEDRQEEAVARP
jgi:hypothetical protein